MIQWNDSIVLGKNLLRLGLHFYLLLQSTWQWVDLGMGGRMRSSFHPVAPMPKLHQELSWPTSSMCTFVGSHQSTRKTQQICQIGIVSILMLWKIHRQVQWRILFLYTNRFWNINMQDVVEYIVREPGSHSVGFTYWRILFKTCTSTRCPSTGATVYWSPRTTLQGKRC